LPNAHARTFEDTQTHTQTKCRKSSNKKRKGGKKSGWGKMIKEWRITDEDGELQCVLPRQPCCEYTTTFDAL